MPIYIFADSENDWDDSAADDQGNLPGSDY